MVGKLSYSKGGPNYFSGGYNKRGYRFSVIAESVEERSGYKMRGFVIGGPAAGLFLKEAARFNARELERIEVPADQVEALKAKVKADWERSTIR